MVDAREHVLLVDDSVSTLRVMERNLKLQGYNVFTATDVAKAVAFLESNAVDLVVTDLRMPKVDGLDLIRHIRSNYPKVSVIMITGFASIGSAVSAMREGAEDYLAKPFTDEELLEAVRRVLTNAAARHAGEADATIGATQTYGLLGSSPAMMRVYELIARAAAVDATVLITGESGTGKELVARAIHYESARGASTFVPVNCAGIPDGLVESELFGHVKGAYTSATVNRMGLFSAADGGTLFLDEIGELAMATQAKLLRVLQEKEVRVVGENTSQPVDVRVIAATNKDLAALIEKGAFREDLFYRLHVVTIDMPPLRDRGDDILELTQHFVRHYAAQFDCEPPQLNHRLIDALRAYAWPGNVRELQNLIQRLVIMSGGSEIDVDALPAVMRYSVPKVDGRTCTLAEVERQHIEVVLASVDGNKTRAAEILGIDRKTLREKLKGYESDRD